MKKSYTHFLARTALATIAALGANKAMAAELQMITGDTEIAATLALVGNASAVGYTDNTFVTKYSAGSLTSLAVLQAGAISATDAGGYALVLDGVKLSLSAGAGIAGDADFSLKIYPQQGGGAAAFGSALSAAYGASRFNTLAALNSWLGNYLASDQVVTDFGDIDVWNGSAYVKLKTLLTNHVDLSGSKIVTNIPVGGLTGSVNSFNLQTTGTSALLGNETNFGGAKILTGDATINLATFALSANAEQISGAFALTVTDGSGNGTISLADANFHADLTGLTISGGAVATLADAVDFTTKTIPVTVTGTAKLRCAVDTTFTTLTLG